MVCRVVRAARAINGRENTKADVVGFVSSVNPEASKCRAGVNPIATRFFTKLFHHPVPKERCPSFRLSGGAAAYAVNTRRERAFDKRLTREPG
jgi:hypothetical protein